MVKMISNRLYTFCIIRTEHIEQCSNDNREVLIILLLLQLQLWAAISFAVDSKNLKINIKTK